MGGSSKQVTGYKYFANFLLFIGNPIERLIAINFDKRGWQSGERVPFGSNGEQITIDAPNLYGENEGGVSGLVYLKTGTDTQTPVEFYQEYLESVSLPALAYPRQSYLAFKDFYLGNSGYPKEMLLWPKRIHVKNDGSEQWYDAKAEIPNYLEIIDYQYIFSINNPSSLTPFTYQFVDLEKNYSRNTVLNKMPLQDGGGSNYAAGSVSDYQQLVRNRIQSTEFLQFEFVTVRYLISYHTVDMNTELPQGLETYAYNEDDVTDQYPNTGGYRTLRISYICKSSATNMGLDMHGIGGLDNLFIFNYTIQIDNLSYTKIPIYADSGDINPIHKIREILTDDTAMNKPESEVNDENFKKAADRIWDEGLGISWVITEKSCIDAINELCSHIEAGIRINRQTGLYEMVLFRDDWFEENEIHTLVETKIKSIVFEVQNADEAINQLNVSYYDRSNIKDASFSVSENAAIKNANGFVNAEDVDFPYFMNQRNAAVVAQWKLKQYTTPCWKGTFTTGFYEARKWNRYDIVKINWSRKGIVDLPVRIMSINLGNGIDNTVSIDFVEVVPYSSELASTIVIDDKIDTSPLPPLACQYEPFEMPYYLAVMALGQRKVDDQLAYDSDFGLVGSVAERPQSNSLYAVMMTNNGDEWERAGSIQYSETADLDQIISRTSSSFTVKNWKMIADISAGTLIKCGRDWLGTPGEWMVFQGVDPYTGVVSVKRGALDTVPQEWGVGTKLYFCGSDVDYDPTEYIAGEEVLVSALTTTPSGMLENKDSIPIEMKARAIRPYPPANVQINGEYYPAEIETDLVITWVDRNRLQQTGGIPLGWFDAGVAIEIDVTYQLILTEFDENQVELRMQNLSIGTLNTYTFATSAMDANTRTIEITLKSLRNGYECYQAFAHTVELSQFFSAPFDIEYIVSID